MSTQNSHRKNSAADSGMLFPRQSASIEMIKPALMSTRAPNEANTESVLQYRRATERLMTALTSTKTATQRNSRRFDTSAFGTMDAKMMKISPMSNTFSSDATDQTLPYSAMDAERSR